jgi:L-Ala-D/L-Glu epimerase
MRQFLTGPLKMHTEVERWPLLEPFRIAGHQFKTIEVLYLRLDMAGCFGQGEAAGVYYKNDTPESMIKQIQSLRTTIEGGLSRELLQQLLPPGGARNALDCAMWDLEAKYTACPAWRIAGLKEPVPLRTVVTCAADDPENMAAAARMHRNARAIKLKLTGDPIDANRVRLVRESRPDVWLSVDANQGFTRPVLKKLMPTLLENHVSLIEQPFPVGQEHQLDGFRSPIPIAADESVQGISDIAGMLGRFNVINIKLDKCGGLTEGLAMVRAASALGFETYVGNMFGTSLAMTPAFLLGQICDVVELDGPLFLEADRAITVDYSDGMIRCPEELWGGP